ncbi:PhoX family phosphatase [Motilimonas sp. E26]|uniref:PhoX family protein n=1 Tax=Motilimonas sp. E26 TaxID=2865674 RepID=UPI001E5CD170|nr:PhoX family phosphatase [Motilimonas sp. E26]MCE0556106.1 PhoX family phosphatase [Motilimonas sp. E26]
MSKEIFNPKRFNKSDNPDFDQVLEAHLSRRKMIKSGLGLGAMTMLGAFGLAGCNSSNSSTPIVDSGTPTPITPTPTPTPTTPSVPTASSARLGFNSIPGSKIDAVSVPEGYTAQVLAPWGQPIMSGGSEWKRDGSNNATDQANAMGMHHDGLHFFPLNDDGSDGLLCVNHEYIDQNALHPNGSDKDANGIRSSVDQVRKEINAHGVAVVRIQLVANEWKVVDNDPLNRRYTGATTMNISGPLANSDKLKTPFSPDGTQARGTLNNCGNGYTPWGTYLTCEENWPGYFINKGTTTAEQERIGIDTSGTTRYGWETVAGSPEERVDEFTRFDVTPTGNSAMDDYRNEANGHGYIVEIDPYTANSRAVKRTALGRFRHEGCTFGKLTEGKPITFYSGHDSRFEYMYKFVSDALWDPADADAKNRIAMGDKYMDAGTLYVAKFDADGVGTWLPLTMTGATKNGGTLADHFTSLAEIILNTAGAADLVGATPMDRPEWCAVDPFTGSVYLTLTNNTRRNATTGTNPANPRLNNKFGHIIRWDEGETHTAFSWDIFVFGSDAAGDAATNLSGLSEFNQFASPDGLAFDKRGIMWIQTDNGADEVQNYTNDQMLAVVPSMLTDTDGKQQTINDANQGELRRFFVGPNGCEVTGFTITPDYTTMFVSIQHPGNWPYSDNAAQETPRGMTLRPRASLVAIRKADGGALGV